ncbi:hypothetical protein GQ54DRAFT_259702 [Martensiomyces pterosporus]|nr:hypothetical protein GQ54DRAFT_259702 [Martensiomyces pterosporus]
MPLLAAILLGFTFSSPRAPLASDTARTQTQAPLSVWASKRNPLNTYFAKQGWAWTTALYAIALAVRAWGQPLSSSVRCLCHYAAATLYWLLMTQWFFGPSLFDRFFLHTGGACMLPPANEGSATAANGAGATLLPPPNLAYTSLQSCRSAGGTWHGGHDISGHCFLLLHSAVFLTEEVVVPLLAGSVVSSSRRAIANARRLVLSAAIGLIAVWMLMLYFTAKYFHGPAELVSGTLLGLGYWMSLYQLRLLSSE